LPFEQLLGVKQVELTMYN